MNRRIDLNDIRLLMQVVDHGSFTAAAHATGMPKSTISQRLAALEAQVGTGLLRRTSRSLSLTEAGTKLLPHARAIEDLARQIEQLLAEQGVELNGTLRVSASNAIAQFALSPIVPRFLARHPRAAVRVEASNRLVDLTGEGFDMTVRGHVGPLKDSSLIQRVVARTTWVLAASRAWIAAHGEPSAPDDLPGSEALCFPNTPDPRVWSLRNGDEQQLVRVTPRLISDDMLSLRAAAIADGGVASLPSYLLRSAFADGTLVRLLPAWSGQTSTISVLTPPRSQSSRLAGAFSDFLAAELPAMMRG